MIKKADEMVKQKIEQMRGGKGSVDITHIMNKEELTGKCRLFANVKINPGSSIGLHEHVNEEEVYYILKGKAKVEDGDKVQELTAGDAVLTGGGSTHSIENIGEDILEILAVVLLY